MSVKIVTNNLFLGTIETNDAGIVVKASRRFSQFINHPLTLLVETLQKQKGQNFQLTDVEEIT